jgi:hypothetical protein
MYMTAAADKQVKELLIQPALLLIDELDSNDELGSKTLVTTAN